MTFFTVQMYTGHHDIIHCMTNKLKKGKNIIERQSRKLLNSLTKMRKFGAHLNRANALHDLFIRKRKVFFLSLSTCKICISRRDVGKVLSKEQIPRARMLAFVDACIVESRSGGVDRVRPYREFQYAR